MKDSFQDALRLLRSSRSPERRRAARSLRRLQDSAACSFLIEALRSEVEDPRTWETQYHIIMAIGECGCKKALALLIKLARQKQENTVIYTALGDAIVRLSSLSNDGVSAVLALLDSRNLDLIDGAFRALAMLRVKPTEQEIAIILKFVQNLSREEAIDRGLWFWVSVAAGDWQSSEAHTFLKTAASSKREDLAKAARASLQGKFIKYKIL